MPDLDGIQAIKRILAFLGKRPYIIAMTARAIADDRAACLKAGMDDFVLKAARLDDLRKSLQRAQRRLYSEGNAKGTAQEEPPKEIVVELVTRIDRLAPTLCGMR